MTDSAARAPRRARRSTGAAPAAPVERLTGGMAHGTQRALQIVRIELAPLLVVVGPGGVPDPPPGHRAAGVVLRRPPEAAHRLLVGEPVAPHEAPVEPALRVVRSGRDRERDGSEIEVVVGAQAVLLAGDAAPVRSGRPVRRLAFEADNGSAVKRARGGQIEPLRTPNSASYREGHRRPNRQCAPGLSGARRRARRGGTRRRVQSATLAAARTPRS